MAETRTTLARVVLSIFFAPLFLYFYSKHFGRVLPLLSLAIAVEFYLHVPSDVAFCQLQVEEAGSPDPVFFPARVEDVVEEGVVRGGVDVRFYPSELAGDACAVLSVLAAPGGDAALFPDHLITCLSQAILG